MGPRRLRGCGGAYLPGGEPALLRPGGSLGGPAPYRLFQGDRAGPLVRIHIVCVGRLKRDDLARSAADYLARINRYHPCTITEVREEKFTAGRTKGEVLEREGHRLLAHIDTRDYCVVLTEAGRRFSSVEFARFMEEKLLRSGRNVTFIVGGALGLSPALHARAEVELSLSPMTFPHRLARLVLLEQIYRAFTIIRNEPYHK
ncbi:MAG: 23S rRNA (pseudouridine(1915)-N(3))-methyltransferase RlmH [Deltaproteobacteria bacterium]|nr:MAG: 23S rRNA (pseudouridine(1915)-N(3))-methyltransferase RlmH [Deltaproteobacteria bacterium]